VLATLLGAMQALSAGGRKTVGQAIRGLPRSPPGAATSNVLVHRCLKIMPGQLNDCERFLGRKAAATAALVRGAQAAREMGARVTLCSRAPRRRFPRRANSRHNPATCRCMHDCADRRAQPTPIRRKSTSATLLRVTGGQTDEALAATDHSPVLPPASRGSKGHGVRFPARAWAATLHLGRTNAFFLGGGQGSWSTIILPPRSGWESRFTTMRKWWIWRIADGSFDLRRRFRSAARKRKLAAKALGPWRRADSEIQPGMAQGGVGSGLRTISSSRGTP